VKPARVILVLSGGGMKAMAQVGVLRALGEAGLEPAEVVATSAGALVGALWAGGMPYERIVETVCRITRNDLFVLNRTSLLLKGLGAGSVIKAEPVAAFLVRVMPENDFARLARPLRVTAVDLDSGELVVFGAGGGTDCTVAQAVYASMALPLYLPPAQIAGRQYADGGLRQVLPLDAARGAAVAGAGADLVVAVDVGPVAAGPPPWVARAPALLAAHDRAVSVLMADQRDRQLAAWRADASLPALLLVRPAIDSYATFAFDRTVDFIEAGYRAAHAAIAGRDS
jgi:NTE family protein